MAESAVLKGDRWDKIDPSLSDAMLCCISVDETWEEYGL